MQKQKHFNLRKLWLSLLLLVGATAIAVPGIQEIAEDDVIEIGTVEQLKTFRDAVNSGNTYAGKTVVLTADLDLSGESNWTPIGNLVAYPGQSFNGTFDGDGHTISNLTVNDNTSNYAVAGLFGSVVNGTIKDLTVKDVNITSTHYAGGIVAYTSNGPTIENCHVIGGTIKSTPELLNGSYDNGDKVGGIMGYATAGSTINNCTVEGVTITAYRDLGGIVGFSAGTVTNNTAINVTVTQDLTNGYKDPTPTTVGDIIGRDGGATLSNNKVINGDPVAQIGDENYYSLADAVAAAQQMGGAVTVNIIDDISGETVTIKEVANFQLTIDGKKDASSNYTVDALIIVDGLRGNGGSTTNGASVTLQNIDFVKTTATDGIQASHYPHNLTIQDCTYSGSDNDKWFLNASVDGPLYGVTVKNVTVEHARLIYGNLADDAVFQNITATNDIKVGFNVKTSGTALIENCQVTTGKYAFRDYSDGYAGTFTLKDNTFTSTSEESDEGVIVNRGGTVGTTHINVESGTYTGHVKVLNSKEGVLAISGGYFSEEFPQDYLAADLIAEGKICVPATDMEGYFTIGDPTYVAQIGENKYVSLQAAVDAAEQLGGTQTITIINDISGETVTIKEVANFKLTIDGQKDASSKYTVDALIIVDGLRGNGGSTTNGASVTLQNIDFVKTTATDGIQASHYPHNLTIQDCTYSGSDNDKWFLNASVDGPLYGVTVKNVTVEHARLIYANMADDAVFQNITATNDIKVGFNTKTSGTALIENCQVTTGKYAFRDYSDGYAGTFTLKDNTFTSTSEESDEGVIVNRGGTVGTTHINVESGTYTGHVKVLNSKEGVLAISGGYFSEEFPQNYIAADLVAEEKICVPATDMEGYFTIGDPTYVAQIGDVKYTSLAKAIAAVPTDGTETTIKMIENETIIGNAGVTIPVGKNVVLDLNGKTVTLSVTESKGSQLITNNGTLTITDSSEGQAGKLTNVADESLAVGSWPTNNYVTNIITNCGTLNIEAGNIISTANGSICYAVDNNSTSYDAILNINGGYLTSVGTVIRQFCNSTTKQNIINMTGGVVSTNGYAAIWTQLPGSNASSKKLATLNISGGEISASSYAWYDYSYGDSFEAVEYNISGGKFTGGIYSYAIKNGIIDGFISGGLFSKAPSSSYIKTPGYMFGPSEEVEGYYTLVLAEVDYSWTENGEVIHDYLAFNTPFTKNYLMDGETITLLQDITLTEDLTWNTEGDATFTLNLGEFKITKGNFSVKLKPGQTVNASKSAAIFTTDEAGYYVKSTKNADNTYTYTVEEADLEYTAVNGTVSYKAWSNTVISGGGTYKLLKDVTASARIVPGMMATNVTLDLNGHTLTSTATDYAILLSRNGSASSPKTFALIDSSENGGGKLVANNLGTENTNALVQVTGKYNDVTIGENVTIEGGCVAMLSENQTLTVNGTINGGNDFAVATNGSSSKNTTITINEGAVLTSDVTALYLPGNEGVSATINGGTITGGDTGIEVRAGNLVVNGGTITTTATEYGYTPNGSGTTTKGAAIAIVQHNTLLPIDAQILGGTLTGLNQIAVVDAQNNDLEGVSVKAKDELVVTTEIPAGFKWASNGDGTSSLVPREFVAQIGDVKYWSLADAVAAVPADGTETTITMIDNEMINVVGYAITIPATKNVVIDLNGYQVVGTVEQEGTSALIRNLGTLTIKDSSDTNKDGTGTGKLMSGANTTWTWDGTDNYAGSYASNLIRNEKDLTVESGYLYNMSTGSAAYAIDNYSAGNVTINGGKLDAAKASAIRMFYVNGGSITVNDGIVGSSTAYMGVQVMGGTNVNVSINGGTISGTYSVYSNATGGSTSITGGTYDGYVGFAASVPNISITDGTFGAWVGTWGDQTKFISGGIYAEEVDEEYIADGCILTNNTDPATKDAYPYMVKQGKFVCAIGTTKYETLAEAVAAAGTAETTITLLTEAATEGVISGNGVVVPSGSNITFDLNGLTYDVSGETVGSSGTETSGFQLLKGSNITFKNGTLKATSPTAQMLIQNYSNLTLEDVNLDGTGLSGWAYALSNNCGTINLTGSTSITAKEGGRAFDTCKYGSYAIPTVNINTTGTITGPIEATGGKLNIENGQFNVTWVTDNNYTAGDIQITGGIFTAEPAEEYCAEGYIVTDNEDDETKATYPYAVMSKEDAGIFELVDGEIYPYLDYTEDKEAASVTYKRNFTNKNWQALFVPFDINDVTELTDRYEFAKIHMVALENDGTFTTGDKIEIYYTRVTSGKISANLPYLIKAKNTGWQDIVVENTILKDTHNMTPRKTSTMAADYIFTGTYEGYVGQKYHDFMAMGKGTINWGNTGHSVGTYRWYIKAEPFNDDYAKATISFIEADEDATSISAVDSNEDAEIEGYYSVNGVRSDVPVKGMNIVKYKNGKTKKIMIK